MRARTPPSPSSPFCKRPHGPAFRESTPSRCHLLAARGAQLRNAKMHTRTDTTRLLTPSNARKKGESSGDARVVSEGDRIPAAATRKPCCAGPTAATGQKRPVATAARCTRRFAPDACDESRNHSPNQMVRHVPPRPNALPVPLPSREKMKTEARLKRRHGRRIPRLRATRSRAPRASRSRGRAGARPRLRASAPATSRPLAPARSHRCCGLAKLRPRNRAPAPPPPPPRSRFGRGAAILRFAMA